jgi:peptidoglycan/LPS O-acetylase OafA/YrhL
MGRGTRSFVTLDGLRGVAAFVVVVTHGGMALPFEISRAFLAVDFFFALSGFVLAHAYTERLRMGMAPRTFLLVRFARLYPLYILGTAIGILILVPADRVDGLWRQSVEFTFQFCKVLRCFIFRASPLGIRQAVRTRRSGGSCHRFFDRPVRRWLISWLSLDRHRPERAAAGAPFRRQDVQ